MGSARSAFHCRLIREHQNTRSAGSASTLERVHRACIREFIQPLAARYTGAILLSPSQRMTDSMRAAVFSLLAFFFSYSYSILHAQPTALGRVAAASTVSGHVFCADTNAPARLAKVVLEPAGAIDNQQPEKPDVDSASSPVVRMTSVQTLPDGSFSMTGVSPGAYYVIASSPGYISPIAAVGLSDDQFKKLDDDAKQLILKRVPRIRVEANLPASIDLTLERGAAVSGTVLYDDGSPAAGLNVQVLIRNTSAAKDAKKDLWVRWTSSPVSGGELPIITDDRGNYRISALPAREYIVEADMSIAKTNYMVSNNGFSIYSGDSDSLPVYSGSKTRMKDAVAFKVKLGEERTGEDLQIPLGKLRRVSGNIVAARDGHVVNSGTVTLLNADDKSELGKTNLKQDESAFHFNFVPDGDYILRATNPSDVEYVEKTLSPGEMSPPQYDKKPEHFYDTAEQPLTVDADAPGVTIAVPEKAAKAGTNITTANP